MKWGVFSSLFSFSYKMTGLSMITGASLSFIACTFAMAQGPVIKTPTTKPTSSVRTYPWQKNITATIFWVGEKPTTNNPTPNHASSWDTKWQQNFGGFDDPKNRAAVGYRPAAFVPKLNPFYIALPFNDRLNHKYIKPIVPKIVPWFNLRDVQKGKSCLKGRWLQIVYGRKYCFAQWEDCGPFNTTDWQYVFGNQRPINSKNNGAGIDLSPAIRDYLGLKSGDKVHWRFVDDASVQQGPWSKYSSTHKASLKYSNETELEKYLREIKELRAKEALERAKSIEQLDKQIEAARKRGDFNR